MVLEKAYRRRHWTPPDGLTAAVAFREDVVANPVHSTIKEDVAVGGGGRGSGEVTATAYGTNTEYLCPVQIGEQKFNMDLDTGSADLYVFIGRVPFSSVWLIVCAVGCSPQLCQSLIRQATMLSTTRLSLNLSIAFQAPGLTFRMGTIQAQKDSWVRTPCR